MLIFFPTLLKEYHVLEVNCCNKKHYSNHMIFYHNFLRGLPENLFTECFSLSASKNTEALKHLNTPEAIEINSFNRHL